MIILPITLLLALSAAAESGTEFYHDFRNKNALDALEEQPKSTTAERG